MISYLTFLKKHKEMLLNAEFSHSQFPYFPFSILRSLFSGSTFSVPYTLCPFSVPGFPFPISFSIPNSPFIISHSLISILLSATSFQDTSLQNYVTLFHCEVSSYHKKVSFAKNDLRESDTETFRIITVQRALCKKNYVRPL